MKFTTFILLLAAALFGVGTSVACGGSPGGGGGGSGGAGGGTGGSAGSGGGSAGGGAGGGATGGGAGGGAAGGGSGAMGGLCPSWVTSPVDAASATFGATSTSSWVQLGGNDAGTNSALPSGATAKNGVVTAISCGVLVAADGLGAGSNQREYALYLSSQGQPFVKISSNASPMLQVPLRELKVLGSGVFFHEGNSSNSHNLYRMPRSGGSIDKVTAASEPNLQVYGFWALGDWAYFTSGYGAGIYPGLRRTSLNDINDAGSMSAVSPVIRRPSGYSSGAYISPLTESVLSVGGMMVDLNCDAGCTDPALPSGNVIGATPWRADSNALISLTYNNELTVYRPDAGDWFPAAAFGGAQQIRSFSAVGNKGVLAASDGKIYFVNGVVSGTPTLTEAPSAGLPTGDRVAVWTNGAVVLAYVVNPTFSAQGKVYALLMP